MLPFHYGSLTDRNGRVSCNNALPGKNKSALFQIHLYHMYVKCATKFLTNTIGSKSKVYINPMQCLCEKKHDKISP